MTGKVFGILAEASAEPVEQVVEQQVAQQAVEISRGMLIGAGILFLALIAVCICLVVICIRRGKKNDICPFSGCFTDKFFSIGKNIFAVPVAGHLCGRYSYVSHRVTSFELYRWK